jgi:hypothetical protein
MRRCLFSFVTRARPSRPFYPLRATPKTALNFGRSVGRLVDWSVGYREVTQMSHCLYSFVTRACPSRPFCALWATPKTALNFGRSVGRLVSWSVTGKSHFSFVTRASPSRPFYALRATPKTAFNFGWSDGRLAGRLVGWSVGRSVTGKSHKRHSASSVSSPGLALPDPSTPCRPPPERP